MTSPPTPVVLWDVDHVLVPRAPTADHIAHEYAGPGPTGEHITGTVYLNPMHGVWIAELTAAGADHAWATSWGQVAADWIAPRLGYPAAALWPVIDVGVYGGVAFGHTLKFSAVTEFLGLARPAFWIDDVFGGKDWGWAEDRSERGAPTVLREIMARGGLDRDDIDAALTWLADLRASGS